MKRESSAFAKWNGQKLKLCLNFISQYSSRLHTHDLRTISQKIMTGDWKLQSIQSDLEDFWTH